MPHLIAFAGPAGSGKDTAAGFLKGSKYVPYKFAAPIKQAISNMFGVPLSLLEDSVAKEGELTPYGKSMRYMMQTLGTEWGRDLIHPDIWVILATKRLYEVMTLGKCMVISDLRFENEAQWVRQSKGQIFYLERGASGIGQSHKSEQGFQLQPEDTVIINNGSIAELRAKLGHQLLTV